MPYRDVTLPDGRTAKARVSDDAIASWWTQRAAGQGQGYPDRPPDVDTSTLRAWVARPGEEGYASDVLQRNRGATLVRSAGDFDVYIVTAYAAGAVMKLIVTWRNGEYNVRHWVMDATDGSTITGHAWHVPADSIPGVQSLVNSILETFAKAQFAAAILTGTEPERWMETTYLDFEENEAEMDLAHRESEAEFGKMADFDVPPFDIPEGRA